MVDNSPATMLSQCAVASPQVVVIRERAVNRTTTLVLGTIALLMAIVAAIILSIGLNLICYYNYEDEQYTYWCRDNRRADIIAGSCFSAASVCFLVAAIVHHYRMKKAARLNQSYPHQQPFIVSPGYPGQPMSTQYSPTTGPAPYPLSPAANQQAPNVGFTANTHAM